jgi:hypothetical protein
VRAAADAWLDMMAGDGWHDERGRSRPSVAALAAGTAQLQRRTRRQRRRARRSALEHGLERCTGRRGVLERRAQPEQQHRADNERCAGRVREPSTCSEARFVRVHSAVKRRPRRVTKASKPLATSAGQVAPRDARRDSDTAPLSRCSAARRAPRATIPRRSPRGSAGRGAQAAAAA